MALTEIEALRAYARMINTLDVSHIEPLLDENVRYASQWMVGEIPSKEEFLDCMRSSMLELKRPGTPGVTPRSRWLRHGDITSVLSPHRVKEKMFIHSIRREDPTD
jgi:hypothetical protein